MRQYWHALEKLNQAFSRNKAHLAQIKLPHRPEKGWTRSQREQKLVVYKVAQTGEEVGRMEVRADRKIAVLQILQEALEAFRRDLQTVA